jgi:hypothetical protein
VVERSKLEELVRRLASRELPRSEAEVQADVRTLLLWGPLDLNEAGVVSVNLESLGGMRRRGEGSEAEPGFPLSGPAPLSGLYLMSGSDVLR